jgi:methionyl aminopeptidase
VEGVWGNREVPPAETPTVIVRKSAQEVDGMAKAGQLVAETIDLLGEQAQPGITTAELDRIAEDFIREHGGVPTSKGYRGFPAATCISPNTMVVHGIPGSHRVEEGDLLSVDVGITLDGLVADSAFTFAIGEVDPEAQRLLEVGQQALAAGIDQARSGNRVGDISHAVQQIVEAAGFSVVRSLVGHGVGRSYHEEPQIPNFGEPGRGPLLQSGMTLAIEPMITAGGPGVYLHDDEWSISTEDGSLAAHFEHTVAVAEDGPPRVLTAAKSRERAGLVP